MSTSLERSMNKALNEMVSLHFINAPSHGRSLVDVLYGHFKSLHAVETDDPLLYAYQCLDVLPKIAGLVIALEKWSIAVRDATPDQIPHTGAQSCLD